MNIYRKNYYLVFAFVLTWAVSSGTAFAQDPQVSAANPSSAEQGTVDLDVEISGSGFDSSAAVDFFVTGTTNPGGITVKKIKVRGSKKIIATIDITEGATVDNFDIEVSLSRGRKGKGTELFSVKQKPNGGGNAQLGDDYTATSGVTFISPSDVGSFDYHIIGTAVRDEIYGGSGLDLIEGGDEFDIIEGRGGADEIYGDDGLDRISAGAGDDLVFGGNGNDEMSGDAGNDIMFGGAGDDYFGGESGTDWLDGGDGNDVLRVSLGSLISAPDHYDVDHYDGGPGYDELYFPRSGHPEESVLIDPVLGVYELTVPDPSGNPVTVNGDFFNIEGFWMTDGADVFVGAENVDSLAYGNGGNDFIQTFNGNDDIDGGFGDDVMYAGDGDDFIRSERGNDILYGEGDNDILSSRNGTDPLGGDVMWGGDGCDIFTFASSGTDTIMDFEPCDTINYAYRGWFRVTYKSLDIQVVGNDIVITLVIKKGGGGDDPHRVIVKDAVLNGIAVDESNITFIQEIR